MREEEREREGGREKEREGGRKGVKIVVYNVITLCMELFKIT